MSLKNKVVSVFKKPRLVFTWLSAHNGFRWLSDKAYLKLAYRVYMKKKLDLKDPKTFNEKLQWLKLYDRKPEYTVMVDKYEAKKYVADLIGEEYIIPTLGVWERFEDIDFDALPDQFVLKCTHDSGGLVICRDKSKFNKEAAKEKIEKSLKINYFWRNREWPYKDVKPRIIAEQYMEDSQSEDLKDYKFYCFNGCPEFLYVSQGLSDHTTARISYVTMDWDFAPFKRIDYAPFEQLPDKPANFEKMVEFCGVLSQNIPFLRADFYDINGKVYFGELTFFPGSGHTAFEPEEWDEKLGEKIVLPLEQSSSKE